MSYFSDVDILPRIEYTPRNNHSLRHIGRLLGYPQAEESLPIFKTQHPRVNSQSDPMEPTVACVPLLFRSRTEFNVQWQPWPPRVDQRSSHPILNLTSTFCPARNATALGPLARTLGIAVGQQKKHAPSGMDNPPTMCFDAEGGLVQDFSRGSCSDDAENVGLGAC